MTFLQQYDRLFVLTFGLVNLIRGLGGLLTLVVEMVQPSPLVSNAGADPSLGAFALVYAVVLSASGVGLLLRRPLGWKLSVAYHANDLGKIAGALFIAAWIGAPAASMSVGTELLAQMAWALFGLLVFLMEPIARLCRIEGHVVMAAAPWILLGLLLALAKLATVVGA